MENEDKNKQPKKKIYDLKVQLFIPTNVSWTQITKLQL